jgi:hypothetical protein
MKNLKLFLFILAGSLMVVSCKKGDIGPAGAPGAAGPAGTAGTAGTDSILYSAPIILAMNPYNDLANDDYGYLDSIAAPALTQAAINQDIILGYVYVPFGASNDSAWVSIDNETNQGIEMFPQVGKILIESFWTEFSTPNGNGDLTGFKFKYFIIPPSILASSSQLTTVEPTDYKHMSYSKAMTVLGLKPSATGNIGIARKIN